VERVLIVHTAFLGDVILMSNLIEKTKILFPEASIDILVTLENKDVLMGNPDIRNILYFDKKGKKKEAFFKTLKLIRKKNYTIGLILHSSFTSGLLSFLGGIKQRVGFDRGGCRFFLTDKVPFRDDCHRIEKNLQLLKVFSDRNFDINTKIYTEKSPKLFENNKKTVCLAPGSVWFTKRLKKEKFAEIIKSLSKYNIFLIGSNDERELCQWIITKAKIKNAVNLAGKCSVRQAAGYIKQADLMICNDNGALHMSNAVRTTVFAFFGPTVPKMGYYPYRKRDKVFQINLECRPCGKHGHQKCPKGHHNCMKLIDIDIVTNKVNKYLKEEL